MSFLKSIGAVVAGFLVVVIFSNLTDFILEKAGVFPSISAGAAYLDTWMLALALLYRTIYTVAGGYMTAWLAPQSPMKHVWILAVLGQIGGIAGVIAGWNLSAHWYPIAIALLAIPSVWLGGWLKTRNEPPPLQIS
jgi:hypothetical protein